jgi:hypothetical protein
MRAKLGRMVLGSRHRGRERHHPKRRRREQSGDLSGLLAHLNPFVATRA